eukprot:Filipodium_phascolosomae@DN7303_c0_g1_i1.p2
MENLAVPKDLQQFLQRARETEKASPNASFCCLMYLAQELLRRRQNNLETQGVERTVNSIFGIAEKIKSGLNSDPTARQTEMEEFSLNVFEKTDNQDRQGDVSRATVMSWMSAAVFLRVCSQFHPNKTLPQDWLEKETYAKYRATTIKKALDEGRQPPPAPPPK